MVLACVTTVDSPFRNKEYAGQINSWFIEALGALGVSGVEPRGISDLAIGEKKVLGHVHLPHAPGLFYQASLLVSNDISLFTRYLAMPARVPEYRAGRNARGFLHHPAREGYSLSVSRVMEALKEVVDVRSPALR